MVKTLPANAGDLRDTGSIPGPGRSPEKGNSNPFQYSFLENPMDRGAWGATVKFSAVAPSCPTLCNPVEGTVHGVSKSQKD